MSTLDLALNIVNGILSTKNNLETLELVKQLRELEDLIYQLKKEMRELEDTNYELKQKLKDKRVMKRDVRDGLYYIENKDKSKDGPYCPWCWETNNLKIHPTSNVDGTWYCRICKNESGVERKSISEIALNTLNNINKYYS